MGKVEREHVKSGYEGGAINRRGRYLMIYEGLVP
jgi:hypothetical protein